MHHLNVIESLRDSSRMFPRWVSRDSEVNLREVAPRLYVGGCRSLWERPWRGIVGLCGPQADSLDAERGKLYALTHSVLLWRFSDGDTIPTGLLDAALPVVYEALSHGDVLIHCQAGLSRSASTAYAMLRAAGLQHAAALQRVTTPGPDNVAFPRPATLASARKWSREMREVITTLASVRKLSRGMQGAITGRGFDSSIG